MAQRQRKGTTPAGGGGNTAFYIVLAVIALGGILAIAYAVTGGGGGGEAATEPVQLDIADARELYEQATPLRLGSPDAPVRVVEFADFQCPGCADFARRLEPLIQPYIERGVAQLLYYDFPLGGSHVHAFLAARAARCAGEQSLPGAGQGTAYWAYHARLYQQQASWAGLRDATDAFVGYAGDLGLDVGNFEGCLRSDRHADTVTANRLLGEQLGVSGTPTVLVNNRRIGGRLISDMVDNTLRIIEEEAPEGAEPQAPQPSQEVEPAGP